MMKVEHRWHTGLSIAAGIYSKRTGHVGVYRSRFRCLRIGRANRVICERTRCAMHHMQKLAGNLDGSYIIQLSYNTVELAKLILLSIVVVPFSDADSKEVYHNVRNRISQP